MHMKNWALKFGLNHEGANVRTIYYTESYFELDGLTNPATAEAYTDQEVEEIKANAVEGNDKYIFDAEKDALIAMEAFDTGKVYWYDVENGKKITANAAPIVLDGKTGTFKTMEGSEVAQPLK